MQQFNPEVDQITKDVSVYMEKIFIEYSMARIDPKIDYLKGTAWIAFQLGREYFLTAKGALDNGRVVGGAAIVRACIENVADIFYIFCTPGKTEKYAKAYVESMNKFREGMLSVADQSTEKVFESRKLKQVNKWTGASIEDRVTATGKALSNIYDLLSYFSHPNPGSITYLGIKGLREGQLNLLKQGNCFSALSLMILTLSHSDLKTVTRKEINALAKTLGSPLLPD